jgi:capsular polysaccharide biosynthesis protein
MPSIANKPAPFRNRLNQIKLHALVLFWSVASRDVLRILPGTSRSFGPPRRWSHWVHYRRRPGVEWREVWPEVPAEPPPPYFCSNEKVSFALPPPARWPAAGVAVIPNGRILDEHGWVVGEDDTFIGDFCQLGNSARSRVNHILKLAPPRRLEGRTLNLCSVHAIVNYYHYVVDAVGRFALVRSAGFSWDDFDHIVMPRFRTAATAEIDQAIGVPMDRVIRMGRHEQFICDTLVQPSFPGLNARTPPWLVNFYQNLFPSQPRPASRRLYFGREGKRSAVNSAAIDARMEELGFEKVDPMKTPHLREKLSEASHVVGVHGAALTNLLFCRPGTRVLEIMPTDISGFHSRYYYYTLSTSGQMPYGVVVGQSLKGRALNVLPQSWSDFRVDMTDLDRGLEALLAK